jgi:hypothetical protein
MALTYPWLYARDHMNFQEAHFGLNHEKEVMQLRVTFPTGIVRTMEHIPANKIITVQE